MSLAEIFDYTNRDGQDTIDSFLNRLREMGLRVDRWRDVESHREDLPNEAERLAVALLGETLATGLATLRDRRGETDSPGISEMYRRLIDSQLGIWCSEAISDYVISRFFPQFADAVKVPESDTKQLLLELLKSCSNPALNQTYVRAGDFWATEEVIPEEVLNFYQTAVTTAPYATLHNELGAIFLYRSGIQPDAIGSDEDLVLTINNYEDGYKHADLVSDEMLAGPVMPEYRNQLLQMALQCYAAAYGYFTRAARSDELKWTY